MKFPLFIFLLLIIPNLKAQRIDLAVNHQEFYEAYAILAYSEVAEEWGVAFLSNTMNAGNMAISIEPGVGATIYIAEINKAHQRNVLDQLKSGKSLNESLNFILQEDADSLSRQIGLIDKSGQGLTYAGSGLQRKDGYAGSIIGDNYIIIGNTLADAQALKQMAKAYEEASGEIAQRMLEALKAGSFYGGAIQGPQSAALLIKTKEYSLGKDINLRVDYAPQAVQKLDDLLSDFYTRQLLDEAIINLKKNYKADQKLLLNQVKIRAKGYFGIYPRLVMTYLLARKEETAWKLIQEALSNEPSWERYLPHFYALISYPAYANSIDVSRFTLKDWYKAIQGYLELHRVDEAIALINQTLKKYDDKAYTYYLMGKAYQMKGNKKLARKSYQRSLKLDASIKEAEMALQALTK